MIGVATEMKTHDSHIKHEIVIVHLFNCISVCSPRIQVSTLCSVALPNLEKLYESY